MIEWGNRNGKRRGFYCDLRGKLVAFQKKKKAKITQKTTKDKEDGDE